MWKRISDYAIKNEKGYSICKCIVKGITKFCCFKPGAKYEAFLITTDVNEAKAACE